MRGAIDLPSYQLLLQPSVQRALNLTDEQRTRLQDIADKYWPERRQIAGRELAQMESAAQRELAAYDAKSGNGGSVSSTPVGDISPFSKELVEKLERQWRIARKQIEDVLTAEQLRKLKDVTFRTFAFGGGVISEPQVLERLGIAKNQQDALRALELRLQKEKDRRLRSVTRERIQKMVAVLTPEQRSRLRETQSPDKDPETDCSHYPYPMLPSQLPDTGLAEYLGFSPGQREHVRKIVIAHWTTLIVLEHEKQGLPVENAMARKAVGQKRRKEMANLRKQIEAALTPEQWAGCKEMAFENLAMNTLHRAAQKAQSFREVAAQAFDGTGLAEQQRTALREIEAEYVDKPQQIYCEMTDKALAVFTPAQQEKLRAEVDRRGW
jgi:Spy/CpxP family protein refolding chaperone